MRRLRLAIVGNSPCDRCVAACCKRHGPQFAVLLRGEEVRRFAAFSVAVSFKRADGQIVTERVLPYRADGRCQFLGDDDRCTIYEDRPHACREFQCVTEWNARGTGEHGEFLRRNPQVAEMLQDF